MSNFVTEEDLNTIQGLLHYLNTSFKRNEGLDVTMTIGDSNGERVGCIVLLEPGYVFNF